MQTSTDTATLRAEALILRGRAAREAGPTHAFWTATREADARDRIVAARTFSPVRPS